MKHAVLGAGAIGGLIATALSAIGEDVTLIVRREKLDSHPERLTLDQPNGTITGSAHPVAKLTEPVDVLWIATKTYQLEACARIDRGDARDGCSAVERHGPHTGSARPLPASQGGARHHRGRGRTHRGGPLRAALGGAAERGCLSATSTWPDTGAAAGALRLHL